MSRRQEYSGTAPPPSWPVAAPQPRQHQDATDGLTGSLDRTDSSGVAILPPQNTLLKGWLLTGCLPLTAILCEKNSPSHIGHYTHRFRAGLEKGAGLGLACWCWRAGALALVFEPARVWAGRKCVGPKRPAPHRPAGLPRRRGCSSGRGVESRGSRGRGHATRGWTQVDPPVVCGVGAGQGWVEQGRRL